MPKSVFDESRLPAYVVLNRNFLLLWAAYGISAIGDHLSELAILKQLGGLERDDTTRIQALMQFGFFLPFVLIAPVAGWWADRFSRKWTMFASDLARAALMFSLIWLVPALVDRGAGDAAAVIPLAIAGFLAAFFSPARQALLPTLIRTDQLVRANALISALGTIGTIASAVLGGLIVKHYGPKVNFELDALTFILSAVLVSFIALSQSRQVEHRRMPGILAPVLAGFRYVRTHRRVLQMILLGVVFWAAAGVVTSTIPALVRDIFGGDIADAGVYRGVIGIGLAVGAALMTIVGPALPIPLAVLATVFGGAFWILVLGAAAGFRLGEISAAIALFMIGLHGAGLLVTIMASLQRFVPDSRRGRVFGVSDMLTMAAMSGASGLLGIPRIPQLDRYVPYLLAVCAVGMAAAGFVSWRVFRRGARIGPALYLTVMMIRFYSSFWCRAKRETLCTIPTSGPVLVAANHVSGADPLVLVATSPYRVPAFLVAREHYQLPILGWFMRLADCIPVNRARPEKSALAGCIRKLQAGDCVAVFPQGTFSPPGAAALPPQPGVGMLALHTDAVVIPVHMDGQNYTDSAIGSLLRRHRIHIRYGPPVPLADLRTDRRAPGAIQAATDRIMAAIDALAPAPVDRSPVPAPSP